MSVMRAAKERKRLENPPEREPKFEKFFQLEIGVRDKLTGESAWVDFRSLRDVVRRLTVIQKFYLTA